MTHSTEPMLRQLQDRAALRDLVTIYSMAVDDHDFATLETVFTDDALYGRDDDSPRTIGAAAIAQSMKDKLDGAPPSFHVNHDHLVIFDPANPDLATGVVQCHAETSHFEGHKIAAIRYYDSYRRGPQGWQISERRLRFIYFVNAAEYAGCLLR